MRAERLFVLDGTPSHLEIRSNKRIRLWHMGARRYIVCPTGVSYYILQGDRHGVAAAQYIESYITTARE